MEEDAILLKRMSIIELNLNK